LDAAQSSQVRDTLTVDYQLLDNSRDRRPLPYVHGEGQIVPGLEEQLEGMEAGETAITDYLSTDSLDRVPFPPQS
jgi:FKBP-type peptidyl-prolyl cis-trans isomerase SlyD